ncbi:MAG: hypothetical protein ACI4J6_07125 [Oscillospiraceae bacterium]
MAGKTYLDILKEHYPNVVLNELYGYCPAGFFKYGMDMHHPDCTVECDKCWLCAADSEWCENGEYDVPEEWKAAAEQDKPSEPPAPVRNERIEEISGTFNYAVLSVEIGEYLKHKEEQLKNEYMNFTANCGRIFAEAQEKLANNKNGLFDKWISSMGFKRDTVYRMIQVHKFISSQIATISEREIFDALPKMLQYDISSPSAPPELVEQVMSGDITTHKEYIALKKELEAAEEHNAVLTAEKEQFHKASKANLEKLNEERERNDELEKQLAEAKESLDTSEDDVRKAEERAEYAENKITEISVKKHELERRIKELESRPVDVAVDVDELNRRVAEAVSRINSETERTLAAERRDFADTINAKDDKIWALEDKIKELESRPVPNNGEKIFALKMTMEQYQQLVDVINDSKDKELSAIIKRVKIFNV